MLDGSIDVLRLVAVLSNPSGPPARRQSAKIAPA